VLSPATGIEPLLVTADASGSTDSDGTIASYRFDFGDGTILTQAGPVATHTFGACQVAVAVTARDNQGAAGSVMANLSVSPSSEPPVPNGAASALALLKWCWSKRDASRYREVFTDDFRFAFGPGDPTGDPYPDHAWTRDAELLAVTHLFVGGVAEPPATGVALTFKGNPQPGSSFVPGRPYPWHQQILIPSLTMEVTRSDGTTLIATGRALFHLVRGDSAAIPQELIARGFKPDSTRWYVEGWEDVPAVETAVDHAPVVTAPATVNARAGTPITISVSATDPDGDPIESLRATGIGWGIFMAGDNRTGVLTWTPAEGDVGARPMTFLASNALTGFARTMVYVTSAEPNLVRNPSFENDTRGWGPYAGSSLLRVQGGNEGAYALQITGPSVLNGSFGANDSPDWIRPTMAAGQRYRYGAWVRAASGAGTARLRVSEYRILTGAKLGQATSLGVKLTPDWQMITVDYLTTSAGSTLDFQVRDFDAVPGEVFLADDIQIRDVTVAAAAQPWSGDPVSEWEGGEGIALEPTLYPSPVHDRGILGFSTPKAGALRVEILDLAGRRVRRLMDERDAPAGMHFVTIRRTGDDGGRLGAGVYFYRIEAEEGVKTGRFVMLR
jgi:hypothetical protein